jgi:cellulose synthase/poly-beta-1,6-N-acetylglucosamine synthase-like glycosyltransferase
VIVTDADASWSSDILLKALPYLSDPKVGAITGRVTPSNIDSNWVTKAEDKYLGLMSMVRLGESKIHSTIRFEGCFCAFKKNSFDEFDTKSGADDSGTALKVIQNKYRAILVPEAETFVDAPHSFTLRVKTKIRRATHLTELWFQCLRLFLKGHLFMPKRLFIPELMISIFNPIAFVILTCISLMIIIKNPIFFIPSILGLLIIFLTPKVRGFAAEGILDQFILFYSIILFIFNKKVKAWDN